MIEGWLKEAEELALGRLVAELRHSPTLGERRAKFEEAARLMGLSDAELIAALVARNERLKQDILMEKVLGE